MGEQAQNEIDARASRVAAGRGEASPTIKMPKLHTSDMEENSPLSSDSGAVHLMGTLMSPKDVYALLRARPKSPTLQLLLMSTKTLRAARSRCTAPELAMNDMPAATSMACKEKGMVDGGHEVKAAQQLSARATFILQPHVFLPPSH